MKRSVWFLTGGLLVALLLAGVVSNVASGSPDGLDATTLRGCTVDDHGTITGGECIAKQAQDHQMADSPFADYRVRGLSGVVGVLLTFGLGCGIFWLVRRRAPAPTAARDGGSGGD